MKMPQISSSDTGQVAIPAMISVIETMPWNSPSDFSLDETEVIDYAPATTGVIYIHNCREHLYIMAADHIRASLFAILQGSVPGLLEKGPLWFSYELTDS